MITLRVFSSPAEAALAKSLLDDHKILSSLADENSYLYGGAPFAMPVRLLVAEDQAEEAERILTHPGLESADPDASQGGEGVAAEEGTPSNNPWELLAIAALIALPGALLLMQKHELIMAPPEERISRKFITVLSVTTTHLLGAVVIAAAILVTFVYFHVRRVLRREQVAPAD